MSVAPLCSALPEHAAVDCPDCVDVAEAGPAFDGAGVVAAAGGIDANNVAVTTLITLIMAFFGIIQHLLARELIEYGLPLSNYGEKPRVKGNMTPDMCLEEGRSGRPGHVGPVLPKLS